MEVVVPAHGAPMTPPNAASVGTPPRPRPSREIVFRMYWLLGLALLLPVWAGRHFPSEDGLAHLAWTEVYRALGSAGSAWGSFYQRSATWNTPNLAYMELQYVLGGIMDPHVAQQLIITALIVAWLVASWWLSVQVWGRLTIGAFAALALIHSSWLYGGYLSFLVGVPMLVFAAGIVASIVRSGRDAPRGPLAALAALGVVGFYAHLVIAGAFLLLVAVAAVMFRDRPRRAAGFALAGLPTLALVLSYFAESSLGGGGLRWEPVGKTVARFVGLAFFRGFAAPTLDLWVALAVFAVTILVLVAAAVRGRWLKAPAPSGPMSRLFAVLAVCLVLLYLVVPDGIGDGYNLKGRLQLIMWAWLLPSLPATKNLTARKVVIVGVAAVLLWQVVAFGTRARAFNASYDRALSAAAALPRGSILDRTSDYDHEAFDGSFIKVLAHAPEDVAYHCGCVLVAGYHPSTAFYWVRTLATPGVLPAYRVDVRQGSGKDVSITITTRAATPLAGAGGQRQ